MAKRSSSIPIALQMSSFPPIILTESPCLYPSEGVSPSFTKFQKLTLAIANDLPRAGCALALSSRMASGVLPQLKGETGVMGELLCLEDPPDAPVKSGGDSWSMDAVRSLRRGRAAILESGVSEVRVEDPLYGILVLMGRRLGFRFRPCSGMSNAVSTGNELDRTTPPLRRSSVRRSPSQVSLV